MLVKYRDELAENGNRLDIALCDYHNVLKFLPVYKNHISDIERINDYDFMFTLIEFREIYDIAIKVATQGQREAVELFQRGFNQREIADMHGVSKQAVQIKISTVAKEIARRYQLKLRVSV